MEKKLQLAHKCFMFFICSWFIVMAITPVGGWHESNPNHNYYMSAFCITGVLSLITLSICFKLEKLTR